MHGSVRHPPVAGARGLVTAGGVAAILAGAALAILRFVNGTPPERGLEGGVGSLAMGAVVAAPGVLALLALRGRPALLLAAAIPLLPLSMLSFALVTLPLVLPALAFVVGYVRRSDDQPTLAHPGSVAVVVTALIVTAFLLLLSTDDPRSWTTDAGGGSTSDVITFAEAFLSLAVTATAIGSGWVLASPRSRRPAGVSQPGGPGAC